MGTYKKYIDDLEIQKNNLVTALNNKGIEATNTETLNTLVPKVANIEGAKEEQEKTASASPNGAVIVTPDTGKVLSKVTINTIPTTAQATPTIAVSSGGLITVTSKQTEGYVKAGTKRPIKQLEVQDAKTITPSTSSQTAVSAYKFTTGAITVAGDANLTAANIKAGTKIFGITGTHAGQKTEQTKTIDLSMASGNQIISPDSGKVLSKVTVNKPSTLIPDNIKKDVNIGGVVGTLESSSSSGGDGAYNIETTDNSDGTQNLIITDAAAGSSGGNGFSITFPATATNWNNMQYGKIIQADGTIVDMLDYSKISGKTFSNVVAIKGTGTFSNTLKMVLLSGKIISIYDTGEFISSWITTDGGSTYTGFMGNGSVVTWILLADTVLSSIEMYDTD
ncbi:MAG: hypothetical protein SPJ62_11300 [Inconstantimicrobium porci]|uniref:hypothetical protein n=1 Tax=Inconstantimicrobium porci TaxID=2652291 RepID=UPI002A91B554|nr:hypothetical protein [Inconstantimicrobium porci]MDY5912564.1 hypothetical protein [Inconstantimicrobium porci]